MMYKTIQFTGLTITGDEVFKTRFYDGVIPSSWTHVMVEGNKSSILANRRWIENTLTGRYTIYRLENEMHLFFEEQASGVLYKLLDGDKAADEQKITQIIP